MELSFPIEFLVRGTPVSVQAKLSAAKAEWKDRVKAASATAIPQPHFATTVPISITLYYLPDGPMEGDVDNIVKLILDALSHHIYVNDRQVERLVVQKLEPDAVFENSNLSATLASALAGPRPVLYVRLTDTPREEFDG